MNDADFYAACLSRLDQLVRLATLLVQATVAGAWAAGSLVGLMVWRLVVEGARSRWGLVLVGVLCMPVSSFGQAAPATAQVHLVYMDLCGTYPPYGTIVVELRVATTSAEWGSGYVQLQYVDLPTNQLTISYHGGAGEAIDELMCYWGMYPPVSNSSEESTYNLLRHLKCGTLQGVFPSLWTTHCGEWSVNTVGHYLPDSTCQDGYCYPDTDGDGVPDIDDPAPNDPTICGDWDGDGVDDCGGGGGPGPDPACIVDQDGDGVPDCIDPNHDNQSECGDWNEDGIDDCADGDEFCPCYVDNEGQCCGGWTYDYGETDYPVWRCGGCACWNDPDIPNNECEQVCYDDPATEENECACWDNPDTEYVECDIRGGCRECDLNFEDLKERAEEVIGDFDFLPRTLTTGDRTFVINLRIVNPISETPLVPLVDTRIEFDYLFLAVDAQPDIRATVDTFRIAWRAFCLFVITAVIAWKLMTYTLGV